MTTKWCRFQTGDQTSYGKIEDKSVVAVDRAPWEAFTVSSIRHVLVVPKTSYCVGLNYREHIIASAKRRGVEPSFPKRPDVNYRANNALCAPNDPIIKPKEAGELFQYEGELVAVIDKQGRYIPAATTVRLNGEEVDRFTTGDLIHDVETYIVEVSKYCTLFRGGWD
jgi:2-keto-4-pentenoate hydratase/2-oxohepta-3-ene-1,7-dioic acid hydratase in catechol pathway